MIEPSATGRDSTDAPEAFAPTARIEKLQLKIGGMSCSFCVASIAKALQRLDGVRAANVNLAHEQVLIEYEPARISPDALARTLVDLGYTVRDASRLKTFEEEAAELARERNRLLIAAGCTAVALVAMLLMWVDVLPSRWHAALDWLMPILALSTIFGPGRHILAMAWASLRRGILNQHVLLVLGAFGGLAGGFLGYLSSDFPLPDFFAVAVFITTYHLLSGYVSLRVRTRSSQVVRKLLALVPPTARLVRDGHEAELPIELIQPGDHVRIRPGESIPVDGQVIDGRSGVDESLVTGESMPREKAPGDHVIGGSINQTGTLLVRVAKVGEESFLQQVARQVEESRALKPGILAVVDRVLQVYVPAVLVVAGAALLVWTLGAWLVTGAPNWTRGIFAALAVLVMGYPCALGMATPLAMIRGGGAAAERGILVRSAGAFQVLKDVKPVVIDKTGTITRGAPAVVEVVALAGPDRRDVLRLAASAEHASEHPLARAIVAAAEAQAIDLPAARDFQSTPGKGVTATIDGRRVAVGSPQFVAGGGVEMGPVREQVEAIQTAAQTAIAVAIDGRIAGLVAIADRIKPDARDAIRRMREAGLDPVMVTGDHERTARAIAAEVGITEYRAGALPQDKAAMVRELQRGPQRAGALGLERRGVRVAMVGDGINDAPALMQADVGIAIGAGTDIAIEAADVVLVGERLGAVVEAYQIGKAAYRKTVQNLSLAFAFNGIGVPLAATGLVHPVWAMVAMAASVTTVLTNSFAGRLLPARRSGREARLTLHVANLHCANCLASIRESVCRLEGIDEVTGDPSRQIVTVTYREGTAEPDGIREAIVERGFQIA